MSEFCICTLSGARVDLECPDPATIRFGDIAHGLARIARYCGGTSVAYSVAEHSVRVSDLVWLWTADRTAALAALLHDAAEAYVGDIPAPVRRLMLHGGSRIFDDIEASVLAAVMRAAGLHQDLAVAIVKGWRPAHDVANSTCFAIFRADQILYAMETRDLRHPDAAPTDIPDDITPGPVRIRPWPVDLAETEFLSRLAELLDEEHPFRAELAGRDVR